MQMLCKVGIRRLGAFADTFGVRSTIALTSRVERRKESDEGGRRKLRAGGFCSTVLMRVRRMSMEGITLISSVGAHHNAPEYIHISICPRDLSFQISTVHPVREPMVASVASEERVRQQDVPHSDINHSTTR